MNNWFTRLFVGAALLTSVTACEKDETKVVLNNSAAPKLTASASATALSLTTPNAPAVTYTWTPAEYGYKAAVTYVLQFAKAGTNFANTVDLDLGSGTTKSFTQAELNKVYNDIDCNLPVTPAPLALDVRVRATVGVSVPPSLSEVKSILASPYQAVTIPTDQWGIVGPAADGWPGPTDTDRVMTYDCRIRSFVLTTTFTADKFKFRRNKSWGVNLGGPAGDLAQGVKLTTGGDDLTITKAGKYTVILTVDETGGAVTGGKVVLK